LSLTSPAFTAEVATAEAAIVAAKAAQAQEIVDLRTDVAELKEGHGPFLFFPSLFA
jgi:hypothetical protein